MRKQASLEDVVDRLDQLITLWKIANIDIIRKVREQNKKDKVLKRIIKLADGTREYGALADEVAKETGKTSRTVKEKIAYLVEKGAIKGVRKGHKVYYEKTGLYD